MRALGCKARRETYEELVEEARCLGQRLCKRAREALREGALSSMQSACREEIVRDSFKEGLWQRMRGASLVRESP